MGLINLLGLGVEVNAEKALDYFLNSAKDDRSLNAIGYIYFKAPDYLDLSVSPDEKKKFGSIGKSLKKAKSYFEASAKKGNTNAHYNLGCFYLSG